MITTRINGIELWKFEKMKGVRDIIHGITGRYGGVSVGNYGSLNFSFKSGDQAENVYTNINKLADVSGFNSSNSYFPLQSHTCNIRIVDKNTQKNDLTDTDALITNEAGICIGVLAADCVPVLLFDPIKKVVAAVHAGWRGTIGNIAGSTIEQMCRQFNSVSSDIIACIGPAISKDNYQVGYDVASLFDSQFTMNDKVFTWNVDNKTAQLDLSRANKILMIRSGVKEINIEMANICTYGNPANFFSARRDSNSSGRFVSYIGLV